MTISSRTPEGRPNQCPVCLKPFAIEPSDPPGDGTCPNCGTLVWFEPARSLGAARFGFVAIAADRSVPVLETRPAYRYSRAGYALGWFLPRLVSRWSARRRKRATDQRNHLLRAVWECRTREGLEVILGKPRYAIEIDDGRDEYFETADCDIVLRFVGDWLVEVFGVVSFSSAEWGAGIRPDDEWRASSVASYGDGYFVRSRRAVKRRQSA